MPETADTELQFPANFLKSFEISIQRRQNFSISCNNLVKLAMSFSTHLLADAAAFGRKKSGDVHRFFTPFSSDQPLIWLMTSSAKFSSRFSIPSPTA